MRSTSIAQLMKAHQLLDTKSAKIPKDENAVFFWISKMEDYT